VADEFRARGGPRLGARRARTGPARDARVKVALLADLHGNVVALDAVLRALEDAQPDRVVCLGDVAYGPAPAETLERLRDLACPVVFGNGDVWNLDPRRIDAEPWVPEPWRLVHHELCGWIRSQLSPADLAQLAAFQPTVEVALDGGRTLLCYHGSPRHHSDFLFPTTPEHEVEAMLAGHRAAVLAGGHTHQTMLRHHDDALLVNAGSVGQPWAKVSAARPQAGSAFGARWAGGAEYVVVSTDADGIAVEFRVAPVDSDAVMRLVDASGMPHAERYFGVWRGR